MSDNIRVYYYNGEWQPYDYLHDHYGITLAPSTPITVYDDSLNQYDGWVEKDTNNIWVARDGLGPSGVGQWYTQDTLPYWIKLDTKYKVYLIDNPMYLDTYKLRTNEMYEYYGSLQTFNYMHNGYGITKTPSTIYLVQDGMIKCWYNKDLTQKPYWDVESVQWVEEPQHHSGSGGINDVGSTGIFLYSNPTGYPRHYGALVDGSTLTPMCMNYPDSGELSCIRFPSIAITGTWKLLSEAAKSSNNNKCIVFAIKIAEDDNAHVDSTDNNNLQDQQVSPLSSPHSGTITEIIEYDL